MSIQSNVGKLCAGALLLVFSNISIAESVLDNLFVDVSYGEGVLEPGDASVDLTQATIGLGLELSDNLFLEAAFADVEFEGASSDMYKVNLGYQQVVKPEVVAYGTIGAAQWDSTDIDESETGVGIGLGALWGGSQLRFKVGYEYFASFESDAIFEDIHIVSVGVRYNFGDNGYRGVNTATSGGSLKRVTACEEEYKSLFFICDQDK